MSMASKLTDKHKQLIEVFAKKAGNISATCSALGISRQTYYRWIKEIPELEEAVTNAQEALIDNVETKLLSLINDGNLQAVLFFLRTKGRERGYIERVEHTGNNGGKIDVTIEVLGNESKPQD